MTEPIRLPLTFFGGATLVLADVERFEQPFREVVCRQALAERRVAQLPEELLDRLRAKGRFHLALIDVNLHGPLLAAPQSGVEAARDLDRRPDSLVRDQVGVVLAGRHKLDRLERAQRRQRFRRILAAEHHDLGDLLLRPRHQPDRQCPHAHHQHRHRQHRHNDHRDDRAPVPQGIEQLLAINNPDVAQGAHFPSTSRTKTSSRSCVPVRSRNCPSVASAIIRPL